MRDPEWEAIEAELKRDVPVDPVAMRLVMQRVREAVVPPWPRRAWQWMVRPRRISVSPVGGLLSAATFAALILFATRAGTDLATGGALPADAIAGGAAAEIQDVQFVLVADDASEVAMAGDFNDWNPGATPLGRTGVAGVWSVVVPLPPGAYLYAFVVDGDTWVADAAAPRAPENAFGGPTSIVVVGEEL
jgi:hypothetical protein